MSKAAFDAPLCNVAYMKCLYPIEGREPQMWSLTPNFMYFCLKVTLLNKPESRSKIAKMPPRVDEVFKLPMVSTIHSPNQDMSSLSSLSKAQQNWSLNVRHNKDLTTRKAFTNISQRLIHSS